MRIERIYLLILLLGIALGACSKSNESRTADQSATQDQAAVEQAQEPQESAPVEETAPAPPAERPREPRPEPKPEPKPEPTPEPTIVEKQLSVGPGEELLVALQSGLSTETNKQGDGFTATTRQPVLVDGVEVIPAGSTVHGEVAYAERAARIGGKAKLTLRFNQITIPGDRSHPIEVEPMRLEGESTTSGDVQKVLGGAVGGGIIGGVLGGKKGAGKGAAAGAAAGGIWAVATRGNDIVLDSGTEMRIELNSTLTVTKSVKVTS